MTILLVFVAALVLVWAIEESKKTSQGLSQGCNVFAWLGAIIGFIAILSMVSIAFPGS